MKKTRQSKIIELISNYDIETQDELISRLCEYGYNVTQATISRDIRELKLTKVSSTGGIYKYVLPKEETKITAKFNSTLTESIIHVDCALNQLVFKTYPGMAGAVAVGIDALNMPEILGCVAGDDTIIVICRSVEAAEGLADNIKHLIGAL
ncbi:MAG: arginine repressor [Clostridia bacterium]|nr:arginine repressor [Clostridia bacterium]